MHLFVCVSLGQIGSIHKDKRKCLCVLGPVSGSQDKVT